MAIVDKNLSTYIYVPTPRVTPSTLDFAYSAVALRIEKREHLANWVGHNACWRKNQFLKEEMVMPDRLPGMFSVTFI